MVDNGSMATLGNHKQPRVNLKASSTQSNKALLRHPSSKIKHNKDNVAFSDTAGPGQTQCPLTRQTVPRCTPDPTPPQNERTLGHSRRHRTKQQKEGFKGKITPTPTEAKNTHWPERSPKEAYTTARWHTQVPKIKKIYFRVNSSDTVPSFYDTHVSSNDQCY